MILNIIYILAGFILLVKGGDILVDGSVAIARRAKLSPMVIGLTVMGFGTSAPELLVSAQAALKGSSGLALGNVAGSNIANIGLILGLTAIIRVLPAGRRVLTVDMPFMLLAMGMLVGCAAWGGVIERWMGIAMALTLTAFVVWEIRRERKAGKAADNAPQDDTTPAMSLWKALSLVVLSLAAMVWGSRLLVDGASNVAMDLGTMMGVDPKEMERIVGLTVVALGTSLPELFASVMAARKGETNMAVGNIIGSVSFNILCVVGISSAITPIHGAWDGFVTDYTVMCLMGLVLWLFLRTGYKMGRWEGATLLLAYATYVWWVIF